MKPGLCFEINILFKNYIDCDELRFSFFKIYLYTLTCPCIGTTSHIEEDRVCLFSLRTLALVLERCKTIKCINAISNQDNEHSKRCIKLLHAP